MNVIQKLLNLIIPPQQKPLPAGMYEFHTEADAEKQYRLHLRIENDGGGLLVVNASTVLHLNQTAAEFAYHFIQNTPEDTAIDAVSRRYNVNRDQARSDYLVLKDQLEILTTTEDLDPETFLGLDRSQPYQNLSTPIRLDCALTYQCSDGTRDEISPENRVRRELVTEEWQYILTKAWTAGVPHILFTGGEPTLRPDLPELIKKAEALGQVTGLLTDGLRLSERDYLHQLLSAGLDHLMLVLSPSDEQSWEALRDALAEDIFITAHITLTPHNRADLFPVIDRLQKMGVPALSFSTTDAALAADLQAARDYATGKGIKLVWDMPVPYSQLNPVSLELIESGESVQGAGTAWLYVEPDGDVLPAQGIVTVLGNLTVDPWETVLANARKYANAG